MFNDKSILITGGTGSFGRACARHILSHYQPARLIIFSRDELKQHEMQELKEFRAPCMRFFLGDVRDERRLVQAFRDVDTVIHAAALKQVPAAEYNPHEFIKTNINGAMNVVSAALECRVSRVVAVSTDKAVNPVNLYGATKLCSDKVFVASNSYAGRTSTRFAVVRYGNVIGSRGSVIPKLLRQRAHGKLTITDPRMTRFLIDLRAGVEFVLDCVGKMRGGEIFVPKLPSCRIGDLVDAMSAGCTVETIGRRPGEKMHETLIAADDAGNTRELDDRFVIAPTHPHWRYDADAIGGRRCPDGFTYTSDTNPDQLSPERIREICRDVAREMGLDDNF
ncbi:MAG: UDP-N-acetylglucosamine 4,6-dehydratase (inverting) [Verrucomicrobia bacterium]|nr:MAG: UDP-N-acetylglucosamine 4,6-dehydratase (inverting) [Verrucomicrobiota bacterium]